MCGSTSQPNLNSIVAALQFTQRDTGLDLDALNEFADYWEQVRELLRAVRHLAARPAARRFICTRCPAGSSRISRNRRRRMGLAHRWPEIARTYAEVNQLVRRHREGDAQQQGGRRHDDVSHHARHQARGRVEPGAGQRRRFPNRSLTCWRRPGPAAGRLAEEIAARRPRRPQAARKAARGGSLKPLNFKKIAEELAAKLKRDGDGRRCVQPHHVSRSVRRRYAKYTREHSAICPRCPRRRFSTA